MYIMKPLSHTNYLHVHSSTLAFSKLHVYDIASKVANLPRLKTTFETKNF